MSIIPKEVLIAATLMAKLDGLSPEQTMAVVFRALDHELSDESGKKINPARTHGIGKAIYAALFGYPIDLVADSQRQNGWRWQADTPDHGYSAAFEQMFIQAQLYVGDQRRLRNRYSHPDIAQNQPL